MSKPLLLLFAFLCCEGAFADFPSTENLLRTLIRFENIRLNTTSEAKGCGTSMSSKVKEGADIGDYLSFLVSSLDVKNGRSGVTSNCKKEGKGISCIVKFSTGMGTDSPWTYGIQFTMDKLGNIISSSVACPGVP